MSSRTRRMYRLGIRRSVFLSQLVMGSCVLALVVLLLVLNVGVFAQYTFFSGVVLIFALTACGAVVDWSRLPLWTIVIVPVLDIVAVTLMRIGQPSLAVAFFYILPVIWLASYFDRWGALLGAGLSSALYITVTTSETSSFGTTDVPRILVVPITLALVAVSTYRAAARNRAQRVILDRQSGLLETALERSKKGERLLDEVLDTLPFGVVRMNDSARVEFANRAYRSWVARQTAPVPGDIGYRVYAADARTVLPEHERPFVRAARGEEFGESVVWMGEPESEVRRAYAVAGQRVDVTDDSTGVVVVARDVTTELEAVKARDDLMASVTHELKNPLTSVAGFVELALEDPELSDVTRRQLEVVLKSSDRMLSLVTDLLEASRARAVGFTLSRAPMDLADIVRDAVEAARARSGDVELRLGNLDDAPMIADAFRLRQVVDNLVSNAMKYNRANGSVTVTIHATSDDVKLAVSDTGVGLTESEMTQLFTQYYRAPSTRNVGGTGLGLNISREIARQHGGDISVHSVPGEGSTFTVHLPRSGNEGEER
ncbi:sensor histidine kinase [Paramicrobacterium agarici]|nr:PAS domain-containing sensor histidine kinase [Microbacterium agarici]